MRQPHVGYSGNPVAPAGAADTAPANGFVTAGVEKCWSRFDERKPHDVFIVISQGADGEHIAGRFTPPTSTTPAKHTTTTTPTSPSWQFISSSPNYEEMPRCGRYRHRPKN